MKIFFNSIILSAFKSKYKSTTFYIFFFIKLPTIFCILIILIERSCFLNYFPIILSIYFPLIFIPLANRIFFHKKRKICSSFIPQEE